MVDTVDLTGDDEHDANDLVAGQASDDNADDDLKKAIALSLRPQSSTASISEDDDDLKRAIALSLQQQTADSVPESSSPVKASQKNPASQTMPGKAPIGLLGLDRKAMEMERLARLKRKLESQVATDVASAQTCVSPPPSRRQKLRSSPANFGGGLLQQSPTNLRSFTEPTVLLTSHPSRHSNSALHAISFSDLLKPPNSSLTLQSVFASSFIIDFDWLLTHFDTKVINFIFVLHTHTLQHKHALQEDFAGIPNVQLVIPECLGGGGNMHSKIMLLFFKDANGDGEICRIAVPSANLIPADWGVGRVMENVVFVVDLEKGTESAHLGLFKKSLTTQLFEMSVPDAVLKKLDVFDFNTLRETRFVHSISSSRPLHHSEGSGLRGNGEFKRSARSGLLSLNDAVRSLGLAVSLGDTAQPLQLDFITSSLGNLSTQFIRQLYQAAAGQLDVAKTASTANSKRPKHNSSNDEALLDDKIKKHLRIYFPSDYTVNQSKGGPNAAGTICFQRKWWESNELIRECLHDCIGARADGILMHSKILYVRFQQPKSVASNYGHTNDYIGWAYIGSANLSESAWGRVINDNKSKQLKFTCRNWESGVIVPIPLDKIAKHPHLHKQSLVARQDGTAHQTQGLKASHGLHKSFSPAQELSLDEVFSSLMPVPILYPAGRLLAQQKQPWFFKN